MSRQGRVVGVVASVAALGALLVAAPAVDSDPATIQNADGVSAVIRAPSSVFDSGSAADPGQACTPALPSPVGAASAADGWTAADPESSGAAAGAASGAESTPSIGTGTMPAPGAAATSGTAAAAAASGPAPARGAAASGAASAASPAPAAPVVVTIGDSIMSGHGLDDPDLAWPELLAAQNGWQLTNLADDGTGFVQVGDNGDTFQTQADVAAQLDPSTVIIVASNNDLGVDGDELADQTNATMKSLRAALPSARIIAVSAFWGDEEPPAELQNATDDIHSAADAIGATFVDIGQPLAGQAALMQNDDVHPTADGELLLATAIEADLGGMLAHG